MRNFLSFLLLVVFSMACNKTGSDDIIEKKEMMTIMKELALAEDFVTQYIMKDSTKKHKPETMALYNKIFALHKTDSKIFMKSFDYYLNEPKQSRDMFDSLTNELRRAELRPFGVSKYMDTTKHEIPSQPLDSMNKVRDQRFSDSITILNRMNRPRKEKVIKHLNVQPL
jgi:Domain of unknown function (DUF4296)